MSDLSFLDPPIEVAANSPRLDMIMGRLKANGMRPYAGVSPLDFNSADPLLIDLASVSRASIERCARACMMGLKRQVIILDEANSGLALTDTITLRKDRDLNQLNARLNALSRGAARAQEVKSRNETARALGANLPEIDPDQTPHLLYLGDGSANFLSLQSALKERGVRVTAALSLLTAKDYMSTTRFTAALVDLTPRANSGTGFIDWISTDGGIGGLPLFALTDSNSASTEAQDAAVPHAAEWIECNGETKAEAQHLEQLARRYMASAPMAPSRSLSSSIADLSTGLFSRTFLNAHLERQMENAEQNSQPMCMLTLRTGGTTDRTQLKALADLIQPLLRETDCPAVIAAGTVGVSLPMTPYRGGVQLAERIAKAAHQNQELLSLQLTWRVVEKRAYHTAKTFLTAGVSGPFMRGRAA